MTDENPLTGKVALVTGASSGIGLAIAEALLDAGARVALSARRAERLQAIAGRYPKDATLVCPADLRRENDIASIFETIRDAWGGVDILINSGGLGRSAPLLEGPVEAWREMLEVNVLGLSICTREALSDMRRRGDQGHVVHISSMAAHRVPSGSGMYAASKYAVRALTEGLRKELRGLDSQIRISAISPGFVETEFAEVYHGTSYAADKTYGRFKVVEAKDIADTVLHILKAPAHVEIHDVLIRPTNQKT